MGDELYFSFICIGIGIIIMYWVMWAIFSINCNKCHTQIWPLKKCPHCHDDPRAEYKNCNYCNNRIRASIYNNCPKCGYDPDARYVVCSNCENKTYYSNQVCPFCNENPHEFRPVTKLFRFGEKLVKGIASSAPKIGRDLQRGVQNVGSKMLYDFFKNL